MPTTTNHYKNYILFLPLTLAIISCKKFVQVDPPPTQLQARQIFTDESSALSAVNGLYAMLGTSNLTLLNGGLTLYSAVYSDELYPTAANADLNPFYTNSVPATHSNLFNRLWKAAYNNNGIYTANALLEGLSSATSLSPMLQQQLTGEVKLIRALEYFYLANLFGAVPLITTTDVTLNAVQPRASGDVVLAFVTTEVQEAENMLSASYPSNGRLRINKWVATALLARLYLYQSEWSKAEGKANDVIESGVYALNPDLAGVFSTSSPETLWQLARDNSNTAEGGAFIAASPTVKPPYALTTHLLDAFEEGDERKEAWTARNKVAGAWYYYPYKYKSRTAAQTTEYAVIFRLAEQYLIRAEARAQQNKYTAALDDLNTIRSRAGLAPAADSTREGLLTAVYAERERELFCELGHRWLDLKRTGRADTLLATIKGSNWQSTDLLLPIPQSELDRNPRLEQNPGY